MTSHAFCSFVGGETIKSINQQSGAHVELQRNPPPSTDPNTRVFTIRGTVQQMDLARQLIDDKIGVQIRHTQTNVNVQMEQARS